MRNLTLITSTVLTLAVAAAVATAMWFGIAAYVRDALPSFMRERAQEGVVFNPPDVVIDGFPASFRLTWGGKLDTPLFSLDTKRLTLTRPVTFMERYALHFPEGFLLYTPYFLTALETAIDVELPHGLPARIDRAAIDAWQKKQGEIRIPYFDIKLGEQSGVRGDALLFLDADLQPQAIARLKITDPLSVLEIFKGLIDNDKTAKVIEGLVRGMSRPDDQTGIPVLDIEIRVNGGRLFVGPLQVAFVPRVDWPVEDPPPAPGQ